MIAPSLISWGVEALIASALLMAAVLAGRGIVRRCFGPQIAYALWALPVLRLVLPPMPAAWREAAATPLSRASETITVLVIEPLAGPIATAPVGSGPSIAGVLLALWAIGAIGFLAWYVVHHQRFCRRLLARPVSLDRIGGIRVIASAAATGPLAFGIFARYIALPADFTARYEPRERDLALAHELGHHLRGDLIANWAALGVLAVHWYNPVAWIAFRAFRADQEMANDARVLAGRDPALRHAYACAIVKSAHPSILGGAVSAACHLHTINDLKGRLKMIGTKHASRRRLAAGAAAISLAIAGGLGLTASGSATAAAIKTSVGDTIGVDLAQADLPPPPAPRAPNVVPVAPRAPVAPAARDGLVTPDDIMADIPQVSSSSCDKDANGSLHADQMVVRKTEGGKEMIVICSDRIQKLAVESARRGTEVAANSAGIERNAREVARTSLRTARAAITSERSMTEGDRREALADLDEAQAEIEADVAKGE